MNGHRRNAGFTVSECVVVLATVAMLFLVYLMIKPGGCHLKAKGPRVRCTANLKLVALSYALWANENEERLPMEAPVSKGGIREAALSGDLIAVIRVVSSEMRTPSVLVCPAEIKRRPAQTFTGLATANISYFINLDAAFTNQNQVLAGDRNLCVVGSPVKPGLLQVTDASDVQWANSLHQGGGNVALVDGSAHQVTSKGLRDLLALGRSTNRLMIP